MLLIVAVVAGLVSAAFGVGLVVSHENKKVKERRRAQDLAAHRRREAQARREQHRRQLAGPRRPYATPKFPGTPLGPWLRRNGWSFDGVDYRGWYHTSLGAWQGRIEYRDGNFEVYVIHPPAWIFKGRDGECVRNRRHEGAWIHQERYQPGVRETIRATEAFILRQAQRAGVKKCIRGKSQAR